MKDLVIVGGGQSAAQCVLTLRRNDFKAPITIISEEHHLPYQRPPLSKEYLAGEVSLDRVYMKSQDALDAHGQTEYMKTIGGEMGQYMAGRPEVSILKSI